MAEPSPTPEAPEGYCRLNHRAVLRLGGAAAPEWLHALVSGNVLTVGPSRAVYATLLTPQGKFLHDLMIAWHPDGLLLDVEAARLPDLLRRLTLYRLRTKVDVEPLADWAVFALLGAVATLPQQGPEVGAAASFAGGMAFTDPRLAELGARLIAPLASAEASLASAAAAPCSTDMVDRLRIGLGVPDGSRDIEPDKGLLLEHGVDVLNGVDFKKGCYVGQELTARTKYRGLVKKRLMIVSGHAPLPPFATPILLHGEEAGEMRSSAGNLGLALMRIDKLTSSTATGEPFEAAGQNLTARLPAYANNSPA